MDFSLTDSRVRTSGRMIWDGSEAYLGFSGCFTEFTFYGTKASAYIATDGLSGEQIYRAWVGVFVNGESTPLKRFELDREEGWYTLYEAQQEAKITLRLVKLSEAQYAYAKIKQLSVEGELIDLKQEEKHKIEFIGDSITCGFGNEGVLDVDEFKTSQENPARAYAMLTAKALDAEYQLVSHSGIGILSSYTEEEVPNEYILMPKLYEYTDWNTNIKIDPDHLKLWNFTDYVPELIVMNLGTNDNSYTKEMPERVKRFEQLYHDFLLTVRRHNPNAVILCTLGAIDLHLFDAICEVVSQVKEETKDDRIHTFAFDQQRDEDGLGSCYHPTTVTHQKMADKLVPYVKNVMNWD